MPPRELSVSAPRALRSGLDLLGIEPDSMKTSLHPDAASAGYGSFNGVQLRVPDKTRPSRNSLGERWTSFKERLETRRDR